MTDKELLELAAKAAGIEGKWSRWHQTYGDCWVEGFDIGGPILWNPLTDDGDALRLAVKLSMKVYVGEAYPWNKEIADYSHKFAGLCDEDEEPDPYAATRRAIVRAAAEIGKAST